MGNWNINIQGVGCHHNQSNPTDANLMAANFVSHLKAAGHTVQSASFTYGSAALLHKRNGKEAYQRYREFVGNKNFRGDPMPDFDDITELQRAGWEHCVNL